MVKVKPTIQALLICLVCLFALNVQAQEFKDVSSHPVLSETKKNLADQREMQIDIPQTPTQSFTPTERAATAAQVQQLEVISNSALTKTTAQKRAVEGQSNVVVDYNPEPVKMTLQQLQQISLLFVVLLLIRVAILVSL